jgi:fibro-slime domain-containing protein
LDFTASSGDDLEIITSSLGSDRKPVYKNSGDTTATTHGQVAFDQWFHDVPGTNLRVNYPVVLSVEDSGEYRFAGTNSNGDTRNCRTSFFPIDDGGPYATSFGNQGDAHNYSFTLELHALFTYSGGETFHICGDDDLFVFINKELVVNYGGFHLPAGADLELDALGLNVGQDYPLDIFYAERQPEGAVFAFTTNLELLSVLVE